MKFQLPLAFFAFALFGISHLVYAQSVISFHEMDKPKSRVQNIFYHDSDSLLHVLFLDKKELTILNYDKDFSNVDQQIIETDKRRKYKEHIGHALRKDGSLNLYFTNERRRGMMLAKLSADASFLNYQEMDIDFKRQSFLYSVSHNENFYVLTFDTKSNLLLYELDNAGHNLTQFPLDSLSYEYEDMGYDYNIGKALKTGMLGQVGDSKVIALEENLPNSIELVSNEAKIIKRGNKLFLLIDLDDKRTDVLEISLTEKTLEIKSFDQPHSTFVDLNGFKSNSYLYEDRLYQIAVAKDRMVLDVKDYESGKSIKMLSVDRDEDISFSNTPIIQLGGAYKDYRELDLTRQLLRKMSNSFPGVSVHRYGSQLEITMGGSKEVQDTGFGFMIMAAAAGSMTAGGFNTAGDYQPFYNPIFTSYTFDKNSKSTFIIGLFNNDINHMIGEVSDNIWDKLANYSENLNPYMENIIPHDGNLLYSCYNKKDKQYKLVKFDLE